eukprot:CAMPEP_0113942176 /NCGR_PEP_ID=MMETSP1339-20121228/7937_1 /TAXON_ID=94617 /ORGANISM="Fibrocapsa japonica" /LENGTH=181 /DNA_ID=CAMNT_0000946543 /DNA_START=425 /DNA_END=970 /DNA_ORIENTATION=+ /assembly_acc=CAM_ASM_000762
MGSGAGDECELTAEAHRRYVLDQMSLQTSDEELPRPGGAQTESSVVSTPRETYSKLVQAFVEVLSEGVKVRVHKLHGKVKSFKMWLEQDRLLFQRDNVVKRVANRPRVLALADIQSIEVGKQTQVFKEFSHDELPDDLCMSIILVDSTVDIEVRSPTERNAIAEGLVMLLTEVEKKGFGAV